MKELNKHTLIKAIKSLPVHSAPATTWSAIESKLPFLESEESLSEAIQDLPTIKAPDFIWGQIADQLDQEENLFQEINPEVLKQAIDNLPIHQAPDFNWTAIDEDPEKALKDAIKGLPTHEAPSFIWDHVEAGLDHSFELISPPDALWDKIDEELEKDRYFDRVRKIPIWKSVAAAAAIALFFWTATGTLNPTTESSAFLYSEELVDDELNFGEMDEDEEAFEMINELCKEAALVCEQTDFKELKFELDELNDARNEIKEIITSFNEEPELLAQLTDIEMQRSEVLKKMIAIL